MAPSRPTPNASLRHHLAIHPLAALRGRGVRRDARIADVGGGAGFLAGTLHRVGFSNVTVVDPYLEAERTTAGIRFLKRELREVSETFDLIMYHHAFEHIVDPHRELRAVRDRLAPNGLVLLRVPVVPCDAFARYGTDWVQLDAPRHMTIPSPQGIDLLARRVGLTVVASGRDSSDLQFWGSEAYRRGISLHDAPRPTGAARRQLLREADRLNEKGTGDQGWFLLRVPDTP